MAQRQTSILHYDRLPSARAGREDVRSQLFTQTKRYWKERDEVTKCWSAQKDLFMSTAQIDLGDDLAALLQLLNHPVQHTAREFIVLELYRRGSVSSGKAAQLLGMSRWQFIHHASQLGIPYFDMTEDEWTTERTS